MKQPELDESPLEIRLGQLIRAHRTRYVQDGRASSYFEINNGLCQDFACEIIGQVTKEFPAAEAFDVEGGNFRRHDDDCEELGWDKALLKRYWGITAPAGFTWRELDNIAFGTHIWIACGKRHYDAECPDGVDSFFDLPLFRRYLIEHARQSGRFMPDVPVEDVVPPPQCPVPNPI